jgi:hypothetical protein
MHKLLLSLVMAVMVLALPQIVVAEESAKDGPPGPEMLFKHLDANRDGVISEDEIPADMPEPMKALLKGANKNGDKKVSLEEFIAMVKEHPPVMPMHGMPGGMMPPFGPGGPPAGVMPHGPSGIPHGGPLGKEPDLKALFAKLDQNNDGMLTVEEFTEGMKKLHEEMMAHLQQSGQMPALGMPMPSGPMPGMPMPPPPFPMPGMMMPPPFPVPGMMLPHAGPGPWMIGGPMSGSHGVTCPDQAFDARLRDLEIKLKALEAKK